MTLTARGGTRAAPRRLAGRYALAEVIGRGGMGTVYRATDQVLERTVAVKLLSTSLDEGDSTRIVRFEREARAAASLTHPGVVAVFDAGIEDDLRFIVMEYVAGRSLATIMRDEGRLEPARAAQIAAAVADALAAAHAAGIIHRDVKPGNVMVAEDGSVKVLDFGIARALDATAVTRTASVLGSAAYMSPEQARGERADERSDIYSLGCVLYEELVGRTPFTGEAAASVLHQQVNSEPRPPRERCENIPSELDALAMQMLAKPPEARPGSAAEVRDRLATLGDEPALAPAGATTARTATLAPTAITRLGGRRARLAMAALLGLASLIALFALVSGGSSGSSKAPARSGAASNTAPAGTGRASKARAGAPTLAGAAGALTSLIGQDAASGEVDQQGAQQLTSGLSEVLSSYEIGNVGDAQHKLADLSQRVVMLEGQGHVSAAATPGLNAELGRLTSALLGSTPPTTKAPGARPPANPGTPPGHGGVPPGHGGVPPGQAKDHGD